MSEVEAFRLQLFSPGEEVQPKGYKDRVDAAVSQICEILHIVVPQHRLRFVTPLDGEGWLLVKILVDAQMSLETLVAGRTSEILRLEAQAATSEVRKHCECLMSMIRRVRLFRGELDELYTQAREAHRRLSTLSIGGRGCGSAITLRSNGFDDRVLKIPSPPSGIHASDSVVTIQFTIEDVGREHAHILLDKPSRRILQAERARTVLYWRPIEQPSETSCRLHELMLRQRTVTAECSQIFRKTGALHGVALHGLTSQPKVS